MKTRREIILIGPVGAGKSTIGKQLSIRLQVPSCPVDSIRFKYYEEIGYCSDTARERRKESIMSLINYWKPFEAYAIPRILEDHPNHIIDFGGGHSVYDETEHFEKVENALRYYVNVILLLPYADIEKSRQLLNERVPKLKELNDVFLDHISNYRLAKHTVYTGNQSIGETCSQIIDIYQRSF